jgi:type III secretion system-like peptide-binding chaperone
MKSDGPSDMTAVATHVERMLKGMFDTEDLPMDQYGDWGPFPTGTIGIFCRVGQPGPQAPPVFSVFSPVLIEVPKSPELLDFLNEINVNMSFLRAYWRDETVIFSTELLAQTMDPEELLIASAQVANAADSYDEVLHERFGGSQPFVDG